MELKDLNGELNEKGKLQKPGIFRIPVYLVDHPFNMSTDDATNFRIIENCPIRLS